MFFSALKTLLTSITYAFPYRLYNLLGHILFFNLQLPKNSKWWFWFAVLPFKVIDILLLPEILNILFTAVKFNSRKLNEIEITEAKKVFGNSLPLNEINIDENSLFAWLGSKFNRVKYLGVVSFYSINFNRKLTAKPHNCDMDWLIHELVHILQFKKVGSAYIFYALYAQFTDGYVINTIKNKRLSHFNFEQQAEIAKFYYQQIALKENNKFEPLIKHFLTLSFI